MVSSLVSIFNCIFKTLSLNYFTPLPLYPFLVHFPFYLRLQTRESPKNALSCNLSINFISEKSKLVTDTQQS